MSVNFKQAQLYFWIVALCAGIICWLIVDIGTMSIYYDRFEQLTDPVTNMKRKPSDLYDLVKIIKQTDEYINSTNAQERLFDLQYNMNFENPFTIDQDYSSGEQLRLSGWPVSNQTKCGQQLGWIHKQLNEHRDYSFVKGRLGLELTNLMDSFGKPESGLYSGSMTWLGSYKHCKRLQLNNGRIKTRYCLAKLRFKWWPQDAPQNVIRMGICVPETCDSSSIELVKQRQAIDNLLRFDLPDFYRDNLNFSSLFCLPDERSPLRQIPVAGQNFLLVIFVWLSLVITATIMHEFRKNNRRVKDHPISDHFVSPLSPSDAKKQLAILQESQNHPRQGHNQQLHHFNECQLDSPPVKSTLVKEILECLSIRNSLKAFKRNDFRVKYNRGERVRVNLSPLDSFKITMAIIVVLGHSCYLVSLYSRSLSHRIEINTTYAGRMALSVIRCVDTFFFIFGVLTAYTLMRKFNTKQLANPLTWLGVNSSILMRISPVFMLVYWYSRTISPYTGDGPWWDYGVHKHSMKGVCMSDPWWRSIPYFGCSSGLPAPACNLPGWFIVSYAQISLILPLITYLICKLPKYWLRYLLIVFITIISSLQIVFKMHKQTSIKIEHIPTYGGFLMDLLEKFESTGLMSTLGRLVSVSIGCLTGYLLREYELGHIVQWPRWLYSKLTVCLVIILHVIIIFLPIIGYKIEVWTNHVLSLDEFIWSSILTTILWPILNAILLINGTTIFNNFVVVRFLGHSFWHIFNRLGLCIYLVHWEVLFVGITSFEQGPSQGFITDVMRMWSFGVFFSITLAFVVHILIEAPTSSLIMLLVKYVGQTPPKPITSPDSNSNDNKSKHGITITISQAPPHPDC